MARIPTAQASLRLKSMYNNNIVNRARFEFEHNLELFEEHTGQKVFERDENGMVTKLKTPRTLDENERFVFDAILNEFLNDPQTTKKGINEQFKNVPSGLKQSGKTYNTSEKAELIDKMERIKLEHTIKRLYASGEQQRIWTLAKDNNWNTTDVLNAMLEVGRMIDENDTQTKFESIGVLLGESSTPWDESYLNEYDAGEMTKEELVIDFLLNVLEAGK